MKKVGEVFDFHGTTLRVELGPNICNGCYFDGYRCWAPLHTDYNDEDEENLQCGTGRTDGELIIFKEFKPFIFGK